MEKNQRKLTNWDLQIRLDLNALRDIVNRQTIQFWFFVIRTSCLTMAISSFIVLLSLTAFIYSSSGTSERLFSSDFRVPNPPAVLAEYQASFVQHKWDASGISHIVSGTIYASLRVQRLRMDITYTGIIASSLFDYENANVDGTVPNYM